MVERAWSRRQLLRTTAGLAAGAAFGGWALPARALAERSSQPACGDDIFVPRHNDGRPAAPLRMDAVDHGVVLRHGDGPGGCDVSGAREAVVFEHEGTYYLNYDGVGVRGWLVALATSPDGVNWTKHGTVLDFGPPGSDDSAAAVYGVPYLEGDTWHMFYIGTPNTLIGGVPSPPYLTMKAKADSPAGPWIKQYDVVPFRPKQGTYYALTASSGDVIRHGDEYLQFFSASTATPTVLPAADPADAVQGAGKLRRTLGIARTKDLNGPWTIDPEPLVPLEEQIENASVYYEPENETWFLFTNHVTDIGGEHTDAIWVYWSKDPNVWNVDDKAVVLDKNNCVWSKSIVGAPWVQPIGDRLAIYYDGIEGTSTSHLGRDLGLAWLDLPLVPPWRHEGPVNIALSATASASSTYPGHDVAHVNNGSPNTGVAPWNSWRNAPLPRPHWVQLDFGTPRTISRVDLYTPSGFELQDYDVEVWTGTTWKHALAVYGNTTLYRSHDFDTVESSALRILCLRGPQRETEVMRITEIEVYEKPSGNEC